MKAAAAGSLSGAPRRPVWDWLPVAAMLLVSALALLAITREPVVAAVYAGGVVTLGVLAALLVRLRPRSPEAELAQPDWSVTVAAIERPDAAIAITDRAGRLVCANARFDQWFGAGNAPPRLPLDETSLEQLSAANRAAWREGSASAEIGAVAGGPPHWRCTVGRAGRGEDYLVWQFDALVEADPVAELVKLVEGGPGRMLAQAGLAVALVDPQGTILAASQGFARRAGGDAAAAMTGQDFVALLRQGEDERVGWAREGEDSGALTLFHVPITESGPSGTASKDAAPALMLLADPGVGIGGSGEARAASAHLEALLGQLPLGLAMADRDGRMLFANAAFMRAAGREGQAAPTYPTDLVAREDKAALSEAVRRYGQGPQAAGDIALRLAALPDEPISLRLAGVRGLGEAAVLLGLTDTTEEMRLKRQVAQATKMQAVGQLAGGVAHDFNNVLTAILGFCDLMLMRHIPGDSDYDDIQQIRANSNRAASLTRQLLAFSRQQTLRPEVLQLPDLVTETSQMLKRLIGEKIEFLVSHDRELAPVRADPGQLGQVIMNLVVNARDAIHARGDGRGRLTVSTRRITARQVRAMRSEIIPAGEYTALIVEDDGVGIPPENIGKIFEPFYTTKEYGRGTGLGLSTVYGFVKQSGGYIFAESEPGAGARFSVYLPVHLGAQPAPRLAAEAAPPRAWAGGGRVLLVEDEDPVRLVAERALSRHGFEVTAARDGEEGLDKVRGGGTFDLVVSDVVMPSMDGPAMAREIRKLAPGMPVLFMSGYAEEQLRKEIDFENVHFLAKPFSVQQISEKVSEVLSGR